MGNLLLKVILAFCISLRSHALPQGAQWSYSSPQNKPSSPDVFHNQELSDKVNHDRQQTQLFTTVDFLLYGYNSLKGCPLVSGRDPGFTFPIFSADYKDGHATPDCQFLVPRELVLSPDVSCATSFTSRTVETRYDLSKLLARTASMGADGGWGPPFSASQDFRQFSEDLRKHILVVSKTTCSLYHMAHYLQKPLPLHPMFLEWVLMLNNTDDEDTYLEFIHTYGTHFVSQARFGASFTLVHKMEDHVYRQQTDGHVTTAASYFSAVLHGQYETLTTEHKRAAQEFQNQVETITIAVGAPPPSDGNSPRWLTAAENHPVIISYELNSLDVLFSKTFMGEGSAFERYAIDHIRIKNIIIATKTKYCKYLKKKELVGDCENLTPGLPLLKTKLIGLSEYRSAASADHCVEDCHQLPDCVAVTVCSGCDANDIGHNDCRIFSFGNIHSAVTDPQWQTTIFINKLKTILKLQNTTAVVDPSSDSHILTATSSRGCFTSCLQDYSCIALTLSDTSGRIRKCKHLIDFPLSLKQETGASVYFFSQSSRRFVIGGETISLVTSSIPNDWYNASCVIDDECKQENAMCFMDRCLCSPGFYLTSDYMCSATCNPDQLQHTFIEFPESYLRGHCIAKQAELNLQECKNLCIDMRSCLSFDFSASGGRCLLYDVTSREAESGWYPHTSKGWTHYQRSCLPPSASYPGPVWYKAPCNNSMECPDPYSLCVSGRCVCSSASSCLKLMSRVKLQETKRVHQRYWVLAFDEKIWFIESCSDWQETGARSGVFFIRLIDSNEAQKVWCDMDSAGGGWLVFQRRCDGSVDFFKKWTEYESGFGDVTGEFWLGLFKLHKLTKQKRYKLRVELGEVNGEHHYAEYLSFMLDGPDKKYRFHVSNYSGNAGDSMKYHDSQRFSTYDQNNDMDRYRNCSTEYHGAWWYKSCHQSNLNGQYRADGVAGYDGINWSTVSSVRKSFTFSEMKLKPV